MASTNKTSLGLNMWEASDKPVRQDFVNDNTIIDSSIAKLNSDFVLIKSHLAAVDLSLEPAATTNITIDISKFGFTSLLYAIAQVTPTNRNIRFALTSSNLTDPTKLEFKVDNLGTVAYSGTTYPFVLIFGK